MYPSHSYELKVFNYTYFVVSIIVAAVLLLFGIMLIFSEFHCLT